MTKMDEAIMSKKQLEKRKAERIRQEIAREIEKEIPRLIRDIKKG